MNGTAQPGRAPTRVLVGVLSAEEASLPDATRAIYHQENVSPEIFHIADRPKHEANVELYGTFSRRTNEFDLLSRVDADMVIVEKRLFSASAYVFERHPDVDHLIIGVDDFFSGRKIDGLHVWRGGVYWKEGPPDLFSDLGATSARRKVKWSPTDLTLVLHAHSASVREAARYGAHRALKFLASNDPVRGRDLADFIRFAARNPDPRRVAAVAAVEAALKDPTFGRRFIDSPRQVVEEHLAALATRAREVAAVTSSALLLVDAVPVRPPKPPKRTPSTIERIRNRVQRHAMYTPDDTAVRATFLSVLRAESSPGTS